jgi:ABC-type spermidine/putrescine transport system permease subunit II
MRIKYPALLAGFTLLYLPLLLVVLGSFGTTTDPFKYYVSLMHDQAVATGLIQSLSIAIVVAIFAPMISAFVAIFLRNASPMYRFLLYCYYYFPDVVIAFSFLSFFSACHISLGFGTLVFAYVTIGVFVSAWYLLHSFDATKEQDMVLEEVARDLGATSFQVIKRIVLPRVAGMLVIASAYVIAAIVLDDVVLAGILSGASVSTLPVILLSTIRHGIDRRLNALATIVMCVIFACASLYVRCYGSSDGERKY